MSHFCCNVHPDKALILKAKKRPRWSKTRNPKRLEALSKAMGNAMNVDLLHGIKTFRKKINPAAIHDAWMTGKWEKVSDVIPWNKLDGDLRPAKERLAQGLTMFGKIGVEAMPAPAQKELRYDYKNPAIQRIYEKRAGSWIVSIKNDSRESIKSIIHTQMTNGASPRDMAKEIKNYVGLYPRLATAHSNYVAKLRKDGVRPDRIEVLSDKYYDRLLTYRTETIARTETQFMLNRGQLTVWQEGSRQGLLPPDSKKVWIVDGNPCEICEPMDGIAVGINESWSLDDGSEVDIPTEAHPNCMCIMDLDMGEGDDE